MLRLLAGRSLALVARLLTAQRHALVKTLIRNGVARDRVEVARRSLDRG